MYILMYILKGDNVNVSFVAADQVAKDEVYEKTIPSLTIMYELQGEGEKASMTVIRENCQQMPSIKMLDSKKVSLLHFLL